MRVVIDTNIVVSGYLGGALEVIIRSFKDDRFTLIVSKNITDEYFKVLARPKFKIEPDELKDFTSLVVSKAEFVSPSESVTAIGADPTDNKFLEAALEGKADCIVSGDDHLLELKTFREIPILTARDFMARLEGEKS